MESERNLIVIGIPRLDVSLWLGGCVGLTVGRSPRYRLGLVDFDMIYQCRKPPWSEAGQSKENEEFATFQTLNCATEQTLATDL